MEGWLDRQKLILGEEMESLISSRVAIFGLGGVGGYCLEALVRAGIGSFVLVDKDSFEKSNLNRQVLALNSTLGRQKTLVAKERALDINPNIKIDTREMFFTQENAGDFDFTGIDYIVDAIDTVSGKVALCLRAKELGIPIISSMGTGNKLDPTGFMVADIYETSVCPLARAVRSRLKSLGVLSLKVVYSREEPVTNARPPGSISYIPPVAGLIMAGEVIRDIIGK